MNWGITGHKQQLALLSNALDSGHVAHGYLFAGPDGVGKKTIAQKFAQALQDQPTSFNADLVEIDGTNGIKIEQIRDLAYKLSLKPYNSKYKIAIIDAAEQMTLEAANSLLKLLEEPKAYTVLILISSNPTLLPKTILSRAQKISFGQPEGFGPKTLAEDRFSEFEDQKLSQRLILASELAELESPELNQILGSWLLRLTQQLRAFPAKAVRQKIQQLLLAQKFLDQNANTKLLLSNLMINTQ